MTAACDDCVFTSRNTTVVTVRFYKKTPIKTIKKPIRYVFESIKTSENIVLQKDSINNPLTNNLTVNLPLHPYKDESMYFTTTKVKQGNIFISKKDSITFTYQRNFSVISPRCGYDQQITNFAVLKKKTSLDSVVIFKTALEVNDTVNIRIYL